MDRSPSQRCLKVGEEIRRLLAGIFHETAFWHQHLRDASITVTEARVSPDLRQAHVFVIPLGGIDEHDLMKALLEETPHIRRLLGKKVRLRNVPELFFHIDSSFDQFKQVDQLFSNPKVLRDIEKHEDKSEE